MKVTVLYHPVGEHAGVVQDFAAEFQRYKGKKLELISLETVPGADLARLYDVTQYPAVLVRSDDGNLVRLWEAQLPLMDELSYYVEDVEAVVSRFGRTIMPAPA